MSNINVRVTEEEKNLAENLANYLFKRGNIQKNTISEAIRCSLRFTVNQIIKAIETDRYME